MTDITGKRLLVLGGTAASLDVVKEAKKMGVYVIVVDMEETGISKEIADESYVVSTKDTEGLVKLIKEKKIDGAFCGPSEFNLINTLNVCNMAGLPFYCTKEQWDICSNKARFKDLCRKFDVPCVPEFYLTKECLEEDLKKIKYPVIIKPVDGCSSKGLSVCWNEDELLKAVPLALQYSECGEFIVEKYITNDYGFGCRYIACDGEIYLSAVNDRYTVDKAGEKAMISGAAIFPSKIIEMYMDQINPNVLKMFKSIGIKNGSFFMQALVDDNGQIYFHEMGLRLSGGLVYAMFEAACGFSDMKMMIRYALGKPFATPDELKKIDPYFNGKYVGSLCIPLKAGVIEKIEGIDQVRNDPSVLDLVQYYNEGDKISAKKIGTLMQHFCRIKLITESKAEFIEKINWIQSTLKITGRECENMIYRYFDISRMEN